MNNEIKRITEIKICSMEQRVNTFDKLLRAKILNKECSDFIKTEIASAKKKVNILKSQLSYFK